MEQRKADRRAGRVYMCEGHERPKNTTIHMYEANHSPISCASAHPICLFGAHPGPNPRGQRTSPTTCMIASTLSSPHGWLRPCTPTGSPFITDGFYVPFGP